MQWELTEDNKTLLLRSASELEIDQLNIFLLGKQQMQSGTHV